MNKNGYNASSDKKTFTNILNDFIKTIRQAELPPALIKLRNKRLIISAVFAIVSIAVAIIIKNPNALFGILAALYFIAYSIKTTYDYEKGKITENHLFCVSVGSGLKNHISNGINAVFMDKDSKTHALFYPCSPKKEVFLENAEYIIYRHENNPTTIITYDTL